MSEHTPSLKPCECGAAVKVMDSRAEAAAYPQHFANYIIRCKACDRSLSRETLEELVTAWNTRASHAALKAALEEAKRAIVYTLAALEQPKLTAGANIHCQRALDEISRALSEA